MIARWMLLALAFLPLGACCSAACKEENLPEYKDRADPIRSVRFFKYAVENDCDRLAYDTFSRRTRGEVAYWKYKFFFGSVDFPGTEVPMVDVIEGIQEDELRMRTRGNESKVTGYAEVEVDGILQQFLLFAILFQEDQQWKIDGLRTLEELGYTGDEEDDHEEDDHEEDEE
jgi:hypothetical protein